MRRAYSYIRFSKPDQADGDSLRRQTLAAEVYCDRNDLILDDKLCLHDKGVSAFNGKNAATGALSAFLECVRAGRVPKGSVLVVESLDRLSRNQIDDAHQLFRSLLKAGIDITTLQPEREYTVTPLAAVTRHGHRNARWGGSHSHNWLSLANSWGALPPTPPAVYRFGHRRQLCVCLP